VSLNNSKLRNFTKHTFSSPAKEQRSREKLAATLFDLRSQRNDSRSAPIPLQFGNKFVKRY
jgi:hypothetical protein